MNELQPVIVVFSAELKEQGARMRTALKNIAGGAPDLQEQALKELLLEVHSIKGSSGALGFAGIEHWALETERAFKRHQGKPVPAELLKVVEDGLAFAIVEVEKGAAGSEERASFQAYVDRLLAL
jgi:chemotaxis protein histidine kinase CheA